MWWASRLDGGPAAGTVTGSSAQELPLLRLLLATFVAGTGVVVARLATGALDLRGPLAVLGLLYASAAAAWAADRGGRARGGSVAWQLGVDVAGLTAICYFLGGAASPFRLLLFVPVLLGAHHLGARGAVPLATGAALAMLALQLAGGPAGVPALGPQAAAAVATHFQVILLLLVGVGAGLAADRARSRERQRAEAASLLERARVETRNIVDNLSSGLLIVNRQGTIVRLNPAGERILGVFAEEVVGRDLDSAFGHSLEGFVGLVRQALRCGEPLDRSELNIVRWDTVVVPIGLSLSHLRDAAGEIGGVIGIFQDLTEVRRMRERIREADRLAAVGELSANIAHEIRNPLGSIRGSVEILAGELTLDDRQRRLMELILKESGRVNQIINDFLAFARLRPTRRRPLAAETLVDDALLQIRQHVAFHGGGVQVEHSGDSQALRVAADAEQLTQVFLNLAINACEAMGGQGRLVVESVRATDGEHWLLRMHDSGPGLPEEEREHIFKPFYTTKPEGTGLGLPMVARIVHAHEGSIEVGDSPVGGAVFTVRLPLAPAPAEEAALVESQDAEHACLAR